MTITLSDCRSIPRPWLKLVSVVDNALGRAAYGVSENMHLAFSWRSLSVASLDEAVKLKDAFAMVEKKIWYYKETVVVFSMFFRAAGK